MLSMELALQFAEWRALVCIDILDIALSYG